MKIFSTVSAVERFVLSDGDLHSAYDPATFGSIEDWVVAVNKAVVEFNASVKTGNGTMAAEDINGKLASEVERGLTLYYAIAGSVVPDGTSESDVPAGTEFWHQWFFNYYQDSLGAAYVVSTNPAKAYAEGGSADFASEEDMTVFYTAVINIIIDQVTTFNPNGYKFIGTKP
jgi:hypothetical protein